MAVALIGLVVGLVAMGAEPPGGADEGGRVVPAMMILTPEQARFQAELERQTDLAREAELSRQAEPAGQDAIENADDLLLALERSGDDLESFQANIIYTKLFPIEGDEQTRVGKLYYVVETDAAGEERRKFAVHFDELHFDGRIETGEDRSYVFDGQWLVEKLHKQRQFFKRQVVATGERFDPLRLGEGPFPIPIGQKRDEILERFDAELLAIDAGTEAFGPDVIEWLLDENHPTYQLRLTPKAAFADEMDLAEIRLWYRTSDFLPRAAWTRAFNGNESTIRLWGQRLNEDVPSEVLDTRVPRSGWDVEITDFRAGVGHGEGP